jgi:hypothetical protein
MLLEGEENRKKRFKAMLQYLILREACEFKSNVTDLATDASTHATTDAATDAANGVDEKKATYAKESAEKILREMELKFYDLFVKDDLVEDYLFFEVPGKHKAYNKKHDFKTQIQTQISDKITVIKAIDTADTGEVRKHNKELLEKIVRSSIIENSIMTQDFIDDSKTENSKTYFDLNNTNLIENIGNIFKLNNFHKSNQKLTNTNLYLIEAENDFCQISGNSIAIQAHLKTATSLSLGFLNLTGKIITKALGLETDSKSEGEHSPVTPSKSVRGGRISAIVNSLNSSKD